jgi:glycosyltransferase involved in cell wall biosynthesis
MSAPNLRILEVIEGLDPSDGGPPEACVELSRQLSRLGHYVAVFTSDRRLRRVGPVVRNQVAPNFEIQQFPVQLIARGYEVSIPLALALRRHISSYDIVHINSLYSFPATMAAYWCRVYKIPYIVRPHGSLDPYIFRRHRLVKSIYERIFEWRNLELAAAVHFTALEEMQLAASLSLKIRGVVIPLGVNAGYFRANRTLGRFRAKWDLGADKRIILFLGRLNFKKGLDLLVRSFSEIARSRDDVHLVLAGPDNEGYGGKVREWLRREGMLSRTTFAGMITGQDKLDVLCDAELFVLPSYSENFGLAVVEAMAAGLPVVISNRVNIWREILEARAGLVVSCDAKELADAVDQLLLNPAVAEKMGCRGRAIVEDKFGWDRVAPRMIELYRQVLSRHNGGRLTVLS